MPNTFTSDVLSPVGGPPYRLFVYKPSGSPPRRGWPLLIMTDGNAVFGTAVDAMRVQASYPSGTNVEEGVIVAIGYPTDMPYDSVRRSWDLSPPPGRTYPPFTEEGAPVQTGGAESFLELIEQDLLPWIDEQAPADRQRRTLFGHSFGGLFALFALYTRPTLFQTIVAASPALYWEDGLLQGFESRFMARETDDLAVRVLLSAGHYEGDELAPFQRRQADAAERLAQKAQIQTIGMARALANRLNAADRANLRATFEEFPGETHMSVLPVAINRAVQAAFRISPDIIEL